MSLNKNAILIVDPIVSTDYIAKRFHEEKYFTLAIFTVDVNERINHLHEIFDVVVISKKNIAIDLIKIQSLNYKITAGIYGSELSVKYADLIFDKLGLESKNSIGTSELRYNKYKMMDALIAEKNKIKQIYIKKSNKESVKLTIDFLSQNRNIVIKPVCASSGSQDVCAISSAKDIAQYYDNSSHEEFIVQEKIEIIEEYYINCASYAGTHIISGIGRYVKKENNGAFHYIYVEHVIPDTVLYNNLSDIVIETLTSTEMINGLSHIEIVKTKDGFKLIELNPRIAGLNGLINIMETNAQDMDQLDAYIRLIQEGDYLNNLTRSVGNLYDFQRVVMFTNLNQKLLQSLETVIDIHINEKQEHKNKSSMRSLAGYALLCSNDNILLENETENVLLENI